MGLPFSLLSWAWVEVIRNKVFGSREAEAVSEKTNTNTSVGTDVNTTLTSSLSLKRVGSSSNAAACDGSGITTLGRPLSFEESESEVTGHDMGSKNRATDDIRPQPLAVETIMKSVQAHCLVREFSSPRPLSELDEAATKLQKVYKSYRTRRNLADCAVVVEELWWKALDFASLKHSSVSFFNVEKPETTVSRWGRARIRAAKVGKGLSKDEKAQKLALQHWLEAIDPRHRYGHNLHFYYDVWFDSESTQPFFYWLDVGDGREINLENCPRSKLQNQSIKYLGPKEREAYEVIVENGKLIYKQSFTLVNTTGDSKWIFVLSTSRALYVGQKIKGSFQHSSFLAGGAITAAGRLIANEGVLKAIWPYSGHYLPTEEHFQEFIGFLEDYNVDLNNVKRCSVDVDDYPSSKKNDDKLSVDTKVAEMEKSETASDVKEAEGPQKGLLQQDNATNNCSKKATKLQLGRR